MKFKSTEDYFKFLDTLSLEDKIAVTLKKKQILESQNDFNVCEEHINMTFDEFVKKYKTVSPEQMLSGITDKIKRVYKPMDE